MTDVQELRNEFHNCLGTFNNLIRNINTLMPDRYLRGWNELCDKIPFYKFLNDEEHPEVFTDMLSVIHIIPPSGDPGDIEVQDYLPDFVNIIMKRKQIIKKLKQLQKN